MHLECGRIEGYGTGSLAQKVVGAARSRTLRGSNAIWRSRRGFFSGGLTGIERHPRLTHTDSSGETCGVIALRHPKGTPSKFPPVPIGMYL